MLQQTRVDTVVPYFLRWMKELPNVRALARTPERRVLRLWEGLGYYARARNLLRAARLIVADYAGALPSDPHTLRRLPGIGRYTAGAIASIAFGLDEPALDANIRRVLARVFNVTTVISSSSVEKRLWQLAAENLPKGRAANYNQALMDLGAIVCLPRQPRCAICPVAGLCSARKKGTQRLIPMAPRRMPTPHRLIGAAVVRRRDRVLIAKRPAGGLLGGMWEFPNVRIAGSAGGNRAVSRQFVGALAAAYGISIRSRARLGVIRHAYSHFRVTVHAFDCELRSNGSTGRLRWVPVRRLQSYPMGRVDRRIADRVSE